MNSDETLKNTDPYAIPGSDEFFRNGIRTGSGSFGGGSFNKGSRSSLKGIEMLKKSS